MSGEKVVFLGDVMGAVVQAVVDVREIIGQPPVIIGGLAVMSRLSLPYRATTDLDVVDRRRGLSQLELLRAAADARPEEPSAVILPTALGDTKVDVIEVRQVELDDPSSDPGDRLHAASHAWAYDTATDLTIRVDLSDGSVVEVTTPVAEPGPLVAMKLQAVMDRGVEKQGTDLLDIVRLVLDRTVSPTVLEQVGGVDRAVSADIDFHTRYWFLSNRSTVLQLIGGVGGHDVTADDLDLVAELILDVTG